MANKEKEKIARITVNIGEELFKEIEDFRFERRYQTRTEAIAALIELGIKELKEKNGK